MHTERNLKPFILEKQETKQKGSAICWNTKYILRCYLSVIFHFLKDLHTDVTGTPEIEKRQLLLHLMIVVVRETMLNR